MVRRRRIRQTSFGFSVPLAYTTLKESGEALKQLRLRPFTHRGLQAWRIEVDVLHVTLLKRLFQSLDFVLGLAANDQDCELLFTKYVRSRAARTALILSAKHSMVGR
jgi:hypothetical protein